MWHIRAVVEIDPKNWLCPAERVGGGAEDLGTEEACEGVKVAGSCAQKLSRTKKNENHRLLDNIMLCHGTDCYVNRETPDSLPTPRGRTNAGGGGAHGTSHSGKEPNILRCCIILIPPSEHTGLTQQNVNLDDSIRFCSRGRTHYDDTTLCCTAQENDCAQGHQMLPSRSDSRHQALRDLRQFSKCSHCVVFDLPSYYALPPCFTVTLPLCCIIPKP